MKLLPLHLSQAFAALLAMGALSVGADTLTIEGDLKVQQTHVGAPAAPIFETQGDLIRLRGFNIEESGQATPGSMLLHKSENVGEVSWFGRIYTTSSAQRKFYIYLGDESSLLWGYLDIILTNNTWSSPIGNTQGALHKRFAIAYNVFNNSHKAFYANQYSQVMGATGGVARSIAIGEPEKDPVNGAVRIPVYVKAGGRTWYGVSIKGITETTRNFGPGYPYLSQTEDHTPEILVDNAVQMDKLKVAGPVTVGGSLEATGDITVKNSAVIRISPAGDIVMGDFKIGTNPEL